MTKQQLLDAGFTEEQAKNILELHQKSIDNNFVTKTRFNEVNEELKATKSQLSERDKQIEGLKKFEGDSQQLADKIKELEADNQKKDAEYKKTMLAEKKKNAVMLELLSDESGKPHDSEMVIGLFNMDNIVIDEATGKITSGYKEQNETIRKEKAFLFEQKSDPAIKKQGWNPMGTEPKDGSNPPSPDDGAAFGKSLASSKLAMMGISTNSGSGSGE